jgi:hypothetical protein
MTTFSSRERLKADVGCVIGRVRNIHEGKKSVWSTCSRMRMSCAVSGQSLCFLASHSFILKRGVR